MKIFCLKPPRPKKSLWFAWYPVWCCRCLVWLETVECHRYDWSDGSDWTYFRIKQNNS